MGPGGESQITPRGGLPGAASYGLVVPDLPPRVAPTVTAVRLTGSRNRADLPLLVLGPPVGSTATDAWAETAAGLSDAFDVAAWDLPGHGYNLAVPDAPYELADLAAGVLDVVDEILLQRDEVGASFSYAGLGVGAAVGVQLLVDAPRRLRDAVLVDAVTRSSGSPEAGLAAFDVRDRVAELADDVLWLPAPPDDASELARLVRGHVLGQTAGFGDDRSEALVALEPHLRAALASGLSADEIVQVLRGLAGQAE